MTLKADGTRPDLQSSVLISANVLRGGTDAGWALLEEASDEGVSGWTVYGPGEFSESYLPFPEEDDELLLASFEDVGAVLPHVLDLLEWGNGEFPLLMQAWLHKGARKWMPWEDFSRYNVGAQS